MAGSISCASPRSMPRSAAFLRIPSTGPSSVRSHTPRRSSTSAACSTRSSVPSGSTTRRLSLRACSSSWCSNIIGVTRSLLGAETRLLRSAVSTYRSNRPSAVSALRGVAAFSLPSRENSRSAVGKLLPDTETTGVPGASRPARVRISCRGASFRVSSTPAIGGVPALCAASEPMTRSARSPGVTTRQPGVSALRRLGSMAPPNTKSRASRARPESSPSRTRPSRAWVICATVGADRAGSSGTTQQGTGSRPASRSAISSRSSRATRLVTMASTSQPRPS